MKKTLKIIMSLMIILGLTGCYNESSKEKLVSKFEDSKEKIEELSDEEADLYLEYAEKNENYSYLEICEAVFLDDEHTPNTFKQVIKKIKETSETAQLDWGIENFNIITKGDIEGAFYDVIMEDKDTNVDLSLLYDRSTGNVEGIGFNSDGLDVNMSDSNYFIAICCVLCQGIDSSIDHEKALEIVDKTFVEPVLYGNYYFSLEIEDNLSFTIVPV